MGPYADQKRWAWPAAFNLYMRPARWRVGRCAFSQRLVRERLWRCSTPGQDCPFSRAIALHLIRHEHARYIPQALEHLANKFLGGLRVAAALHQHVKAVILLVDSAPPVMPLPVNRQKPLVKVLRVPWVGASTLQLIRVVLPTLPTPLAHGFMGDVDPAFAPQCLHVTVAQGDAGVAPDSMADNRAGKAVIFVALAVDRRSQAWRPILGCEGSCGEASWG
jgi:hypothetical protein